MYTKNQLDYLIQTYWYTVRCGGGIVFLPIILSINVELFWRMLWQLLPNIGIFGFNKEAIKEITEGTDSDNGLTKPLPEFDRLLS